MLTALVLGGGVAIAGAVPAFAAPYPSTRIGVVRQAAPPAPVTTAPTGSDLQRKQQAADAANTKRKIIIGLIVVVLLVIVIIGHRSRSKNRARKKKLQQAQGG